MKKYDIEVNNIVRNLKEILKLDLNSLTKNANLSKYLIGSILFF